ncbi:hypothetical protein, unlikely [Trypanosoma brucei brucei TREU927]|uniref:Uncharacterized protein n=1 Tax=Trypanosoma brucei brucei (strain 927/4 GUTat10.1) TaxID=185431 RepID=Q4GYM2_TRYB2|nr:hypothetical protein, unlikely [Trypanosoma brucei brucei TREU927]CAJ16562.1 hypothetical protein, unlikely [Trypanosoma brucei brucei TREU927]
MATQPQTITVPPCRNYLKSPPLPQLLDFPPLHSFFFHFSVWQQKRTERIEGSKLFIAHTKRKRK